MQMFSIVVFKLTNFVKKQFYNIMNIHPSNEFFSNIKYTDLSSIK